MKGIESGSKGNRWILTAKWVMQTQLGITVVSLIVALGALVLLVVAFGSSPAVALGALFEGALRGRNAFIATIEEMAVLILTGLAILIPVKGGYFNIGCQGQLEMGALAAVFVATNLQGPPILVICLSLLASMVMGIMIGFVPLVLRVKRGASEVTSSIMLNYVCTNFCCAMFYGPLQDPAAFYGTTRQIPSAYQLPGIFFGFHSGVILALLLAVAVYILMSRTVWGTQLYATGYNRRAAAAAGMPVGRTFASAVLLGAAIGGLAGGVEVMGVVHRVAQSWAMNWGFIGVCVAFLGGNALGIIPITFLLSVISTGGRFMQAMTGVPEALVSVMQGLPVVIFLVFTAIRLNSTAVDIKALWKKPATSTAM